MSFRNRWSLGGAVLLILLTTWVVAPPLASQRQAMQQQQITPVLVTNFPDPHRVRGTVKIEGPVRLASLVEFEEILVPPVRRSDTTRLVDAGVLVTNGFPNVVLSLHGQVKGSVANPGTVGAILLPEQDSIETAFHEMGLFHFAMEVTALDVSMSTPFFASTQPRYQVGFQSYRVWLYNTTDKTVTAHLWAYLTN